MTVKDKETLTKIRTVQYLRGITTMPKTISYIVDDWFSKIEKENKEMYKRFEAMIEFDQDFGNEEKPKNKKKKI